MPNDKKVFIIAGPRLIVVVEETSIRLLLLYLVQPSEAFGFASVCVITYG